MGSLTAWVAFYKQTDLYWKLLCGIQHPDPIGMKRKCLRRSLSPLEYSGSDVRSTDGVSARAVRYRLSTYIMAPI